MSFLTKGLYRNAAAPRAERVDLGALARRVLATLRSLFARGGGATVTATAKPSVRLSNAGRPNCCNA